jgi:hypothetical protein
MRMRRLAALLFVVIGLSLAGCGGGTNSSGKVTLPSIATQPSNQMVTLGQKATFVNGRVYVGTTNGVAVFGLLP